MSDSPPRDASELPNAGIAPVEAGGIVWHPWGSDAFERAVQKDCPVLLYIEKTGSRACHLMEKESFSNPKIASTLNQFYVCIRINRDDRPDLDRVYQTALQLLTQERGGWPLILFLSPDDRMPFFGGTYFPPDSNGEFPGFGEVVLRIHPYFRTDRATIQSQSQFLKSQFAQLASPLQDTGPVSSRMLETARALLEASFDVSNGGFGGAPKQPQVLEIARLLRHWAASQLEETPDLKALYMAALTLTRMAESGLQDTVAGGFFSHCIDPAWRVPNFDKPLGINGLLIEIYAQAAAATGEQLFAQTAKSTANWLVTELKSATGSFHSGISPVLSLPPEPYYLWTHATLREVLSEREWTVTLSRFGPNESKDLEEGSLLLYPRKPWDAVAREAGETVDDARNLVEQSLARLRRHRAQRPGIQVDERTRVLYNAFAIRGLAVAGRIFDEQGYVRAASDAFTRISAQLSDSQEGVVLDDVAALLLASLEVLQCEWTTEAFIKARALAQRIVKQYSDPATGGLWSSERDGPELIWRARWHADEGLPSGAGMAALALLRWGFLTGDRSAIATATRALNSAAPLVQADPLQHLALLEALDELLNPTTIVILRGPDDVTSLWQRELARLYAPQRLVFVWPDKAAELPLHAREMESASQGVAYLFRGFELESVVTDFGELVRHLRDGIILPEE